MRDIRKGEYPVWLEVRTSVGTQERVQVGVATRCDGGLLLKLNDEGLPPAVRGASVNRRVGPSSSRIPPPATSTALDLEYYAERARKSLADPSKAAWHDDDRRLLAAIEAEQERRRQRAEAPQARN